MGVSDYAAVHAAVRGKYATLINPQRFGEMYDAPNFNALIPLLKDTVYGPYLSKVEEKDLTPRRAIYEMTRQIADDYAMVIRLAPSFTRGLLTQLFRHYEVDNLKAVLRAIVSGATWQQVLYVLFPLGNISVLPAQAMVESGNVGAAVELLRGTPYYDTLSHAMERYTAEKNLFPLEVALDLDYWRALWNQVNQLTGQDREQAVKIIGSLLDMNNLMWAIRYREYHHLSEEEIINYTLPFGYKVHDTDIRAIAAGGDIVQVMRCCYEGLQDADELLRSPTQGLPLLEVILKRQVVRQCRTAFMGYPFHIGVPLAYLVLKEMELQDLTVLIEAKSSEIPAETFQPYLLTDVAAR